MIDFSSSFVQPVLGHSAQPTGKSQLTKGDSGVMPRKTEEADSFEKQPQPPANRVEKNTVVPTVVATAILSPLLGALVGEGFWQLGASDEKKTIAIPIPPQELTTEGIPKPQVFDLEKFKEESFEFKMSKKFMEEAIENKNKILQNGEERATLENHKAFQWLVAREKRFYTPVQGVEDVQKIIAEFVHPMNAVLNGYDSFNPDYLQKNLPDLPQKATLIWGYLDKQNLLDLQEFSDLKMDLHNLAMTVNDKRHEIPNLPLGKAPDFEQEVFDRIQAGLQACKAKAKNSPSTPTTQTVEASVKEGVQTLKGLGNWVLKPTETLEKAGGEALEKHATTSRLIAGGVALTTLLLGGAFAFFASQKKPQNQSANLNTSL
jgi:hypothetical protein